MYRIVAVSIGKAHTFFNIERILRTYHDVTCKCHAKFNDVIVTLLTFFPVDEAPLFYWTVPEVCLSVVCANLPTLRPLFHGFSPESAIGSIRSVFSLRSSPMTGLEYGRHDDSAACSSWDEKNKETYRSTAETVSMENQDFTKLGTSYIKVNTVVSLKSEPKTSSSAGVGSGS